MLVLMESKSALQNPNNEQASGKTFKRTIFYTKFADKNTIASLLPQAPAMGKSGIERLYVTTSMSKDMLNPPPNDLCSLTDTYFEHMEILFGISIGASMVSIIGRDEWVRLCNCTPTQALAKPAVRQPHKKE